METMDSKDQRPISGRDLQQATHRHGIPAGGHWFWRQLPMLKHMEEHGGVSLAWQSSVNGYLYAVYDSQRDFYENLLKLPAGKRYAYELIRVGSVCRNYADIEWIGDRDDSHTKIRALIQKIRDFTEKKFKIKPALYVCCSSRHEEDGRYKNSYHVVFRDLHYENNHGGPMKRFWTDLCLELDSEEWYWSPESGEEKDKKHIIDGGVYTKNRIMRLPLASKRGGAPFKRISGNPFDESDDFTSKYADEDPEAWQPFFVSDPHRDSNTVLGSDRIHARPSKKRKTQHHNTADGTSRNLPSIDTSRNEMFIDTDPPPLTDSRLPKICVTDLQSMIEQKGIQGCGVTGEVKFDEDGRITLPLKNHGSRKCIFGQVHDSNNSYLFVKQDYVHYGCLSKECRQIKPKVLGIAPQSWRDWRATSHQVNKKQKTGHHKTTDITSRKIPIDTSGNEMSIETDQSPVTDTSSGTDVADTSDVMDVDAKEQARHCDQNSENMTGVIDDGAGVPKPDGEKRLPVGHVVEPQEVFPAPDEVEEDDFEVDVGDEYAENEEEEMLVCVLPSAAVMSLANNTAPIGVSKPAAASAVELTEEQKERIARNKQIAIRRLARREAVDDSSGSSTDESHTSGYIANTNPFHHVTDHESSGLLASHEMIKKQNTRPTTDVVPRPVTHIPSETDFGDGSNIMTNEDENEQDPNPEVSCDVEGHTDSNVSEEGRLRRDMAQMSMRLAEIEAAKCSANASLESADYTDEDASGASTDGRGHMDRDMSKTYPHYNVTDDDLSEILKCLDISYTQSENRRHRITTILKTYGYKKAWQRWVSDDGSESEWNEAETTCDDDLDLNYIVKAANRSLKKYNDDKPRIQKLEKIYFDIPSLLSVSENQARITQRVDVEFLSTDLFDTKNRVTCIQSCTGTGKTFNTIKHARERQMPVLSVCHLITQVQEHNKVFSNKENGLPTETIKYDDDLGVHSLGLKWKDAGSEKPSAGIEIKNELIAAALEHKVLAAEPLEFKKREWENFNTAIFSSDSYIRAGDRYFIPNIRSFRAGIDNYITTLDSLPKLRKLMQSPPLGLKWKETSGKPSAGTEIENEVLAAALHKKVLARNRIPLASRIAVASEPLEFKNEEWETMRVANLSSDSYIKVGIRYFKPADTHAVGKYILYLDEIHSIIGYILTSSTLSGSRKDVISALAWLMNGAGKVIMTDNIILDRDISFIDSILCRNVKGLELDFIVNSHQKYTGIKVSHTHDPEALMEAMCSDLANGMCFTCPCNTKKRAEEIDMRLRQEFPGSSIKCYTSEQGQFNTEDVDAEWSRNAVIYSPRITTGVDFNPTVPQNVYLFLDGDQTVPPATALQMIARNRNIKEVRICSMSMRNCPEWATRDVHTFKEMSQSFDSDGKTMRELMSVIENKYTGEYEYSEGSFAKVYKEHRWMDNVMRSSFLYTLDMLLEMRGFHVIRPEIMEAIGTYDWDPIEHLVEQEREEKFENYLNNSLTDADLKTEEYLDSRCKTLHRNKDELCKLIDSNPHHKKLYMQTFTDTKKFKNNRNVILALYTDDRLREKYDRIKEVEYDICRQQTLTKKCRLLREMIAVMNVGMTPQLKPYDLTLLQSDYDEDGHINAPDEVWLKYKDHHRTKKPKPQTRKSWMMCIFLLTKDVFGNEFVVKKETSKSGKKCHNYFTNKFVVEIAIELMNWNLRNLDYIAPEIVQTYDLERRKENDPCSRLSTGEV